MSRFRELEAFVTVVDTGSMSAAAERLGVAVSAISRRVGELETRLGVRLANRSTRGLSPTPLGLEYHERAKRILAELDDADAAASGECAALHGTLRVAVPFSFGILHLTPVIERYAEAAPDVLLDIDASDRRVDLVDDGFDLAIRIGVLEDSRLVARRLFDVRHVVTASPAYWRVHGKPETPTELSAHRTLCFRGTDGRPRWRWREADGTIGEVAISPRLVANNGDLLMRAAMAGLGVSREPSFIAQSAIDDGRLEPVLEDVDWDPMSAYVVYPQGRPLPVRARRFLDLLVDVFGEG